MKILLEFSEKKVDVVDGVELCDESLHVVQENLQKMRRTLVFYFNFRRTNGKKGIKSFLTK